MRDKRPFRRKLTTQRICSVLFRARLDQKIPPPKPDRRSEFQACCGRIVDVLPEITTLDGPKRLGRLVSAMHRAYDLLPVTEQAKNTVAIRAFNLL